MKTAIVTGANGFVGSALCRALSKAGMEIFAVIKDEQEDVSAISGLPGLHIIYCDMDCLNQLPSKISGKSDVFYHLAWAGSTGSARADYKLQLKNVHWAMEAVNAAGQIGCKRFVGAGTLAEHDVNAYTPLDGSTPNAVSCYGVAKIAAHYMSKAECVRLGIDHIWAYLSNTYGVGNYTSNFVNFASKVMITGKPADFTAGEQMYDFVYIDDIAQGLLCVGRDGRKNCAYYIGSTKPAKLKEFIQAIRDEIDPSIQLNLGAVPFNGVAHPENIFDCSQLVEDTGYCARVSFPEGIKITVRWLREQIAEGKL